MKIQTILIYILSPLDVAGLKVRDTQKQQPFSIDSQWKSSLKEVVLNRLEFPRDKQQQANFHKLTWQWVADQNKYF